MSRRRRSAARAATGEQTNRHADRYQRESVPAAPERPSRGAIFDRLYSQLRPPNPRSHSLPPPARRRGHRPHLVADLRRSRRQQRATYRRLCVGLLSPSARPGYQLDACTRTKLTSVYACQNGPPRSQADRDHAVRLNAYGRGTAGLPLKETSRTIATSLAVPRQTGVSARLHVSLHSATRRATLVVSDGPALRGKPALCLLPGLLRAGRRSAPRLCRLRRRRSTR